MSSYRSFHLEPWKNITSGLKCDYTSSVRFEREELLRDLCLANCSDIQIWVFPGHAFSTFYTAKEKALLSFHIQVPNEPKCEFSYLDIKRGENGRIVNIAEIDSSGW